MTKDKQLQRILNSKEPHLQAGVGIVKGVQLIKPFEPETAAGISAHFHKFAHQHSALAKKRDGEGLLAGYTGLRDSLITIATIIRIYKIDHPVIAAEQLTDGFFNLAENLEKWAGLKPAGQKEN
jgi:hypothetical protein